MSTIALHKSAYPTTGRKESFLEKFLEAYKENQVNIICGLLLLNGSTNAYSLYKTLSR